MTIKHPALKGSAEKDVRAVPLASAAGLKLSAVFKPLHPSKADRRALFSPDVVPTCYKDGFTHESHVISNHDQSH